MIRITINRPRTRAHIVRGAQSQATARVRIYRNITPSSMARLLRLVGAQLTERADGTLRGEFDEAMVRRQAPAPQLPEVNHSLHPNMFYRAYALTPNGGVSGELRMWQMDADADAAALQAQYPTACVVVLNAQNFVVYEVPQAEPTPAPAPMQSDAPAAPTYVPGSDLSDLGAGDQVRRYRSHHDKEPRIETVSRVTKTQIILENGERFSRRTGVKIGYADAWEQPEIEPYMVLAADPEPEPEPAPSYTAAARPTHHAVIAPDGREIAQFPATAQGEQFAAETAATLNEDLTTTTTVQRSASAAPAYEKEIIWDRETKDFAMFLDGELVGFARTYQEAEITLDQLVFELLSGQYVRDAA